MYTRQQLDKMSTLHVLILALLKFYFYICFDLLMMGLFLGLSNIVLPLIYGQGVAEMLKIEKVNDQKIYTIKNKYLCENGVLNEKNVCNVCNACMKYMKRKSVGGVEND